MTRISATTVVQAFVILVTAVVFGLMIFGPSDPSAHDSMGGMGMSDMSAGGSPMDGRGVTGR